MAQMLCGDEIRAAVADLGAVNSRFGTAGEDSPKHVFRSDVGLLPGEDGSNARKVGNGSLRVVRDNLEIEPAFDADGSANWDHVESLLLHGLQNCMQVPMNEFPLLLSNNSYNDYLKYSEKLMELAFEKVSAPATYIASSGMLSSFSTGRPTSLVVDFGATSTRVVPVIDGYVLNRAVKVSNRGGEWLDRQIESEITSAGKEVRPWFETDGKVYPAPRQSFREMHLKDTVRDVKHWMTFVTHARLDETAREELFTRVTIPPYVLPDGTEIPHSVGLCSTAEQWFAQTAAAKKRPRSAPLPETPSTIQPLEIADTNLESLQDLIYSSVAHCDVDVRKDLLGNIILVGGGSLIDGVSQRLSYELADLLPSNMKVKTVLPLPVERLNAAWIGGSILSICGSFQQLWITKPEYEEYGSISLSQHRLMY